MARNLRGSTGALKNDWKKTAGGSMTAHYSLLADASPGNESLRVYSPFDGTLLAEVDTVDEQGGRQALACAHELYVARNLWLTPSERLEILAAATAKLAEQADRLADIALKEGGKPLVDTRIELARAVDGLRLCAQCIRTGHGEEIPMGINPASSGRLALTHREPIGVVLAYSAFNHPSQPVKHPCPATSWLGFYSRLVCPPNGVR